MAATVSGLRWLETIPGTGPMLVDGDIAVMAWTAVTDDGKQFEQQGIGKPPVRMPVAEQMPRWWHEGMKLMRTGGSYRFEVPIELTWPQPLRPAALAGAKSLHYDVKVLEVVQAPVFVKPDARKATAVDGFVYEVVQPGAGDPPRPGNTCELHFACWDEAGGLVESTRAMGMPVRLVPDKAAAPFLGNVALRMSKGARFRCSVPVELVYPRGHSVLRPKSTLYWDIELIGFDP